MWKLGGDVWERSGDEKGTAALRPCPASPPAPAADSPSAVEWMEMDGNSGTAQLEPDLRKRYRKVHSCHMHSSLNTSGGAQHWFASHAQSSSSDMDGSGIQSVKSAQAHLLCHTPIAAKVWEENPRNHLNISQTGQTFFPPSLISSAKVVGGWDGVKNTKQSHKNHVDN